MLARIGDRAGRVVVGIGSILWFRRTEPMRVTMTTMLTFDRIEPGDDFGVVSVDPRSAPDASALLFGADASDRVPPALLVALSMRGYLALVPDRPPGNVHAGQTLDWGSPAPANAPLSVGLRCVGKDWRNERRWLRFEVRVFSSHGTHLTAVNTMIWGA